MEIRFAELRRLAQYNLMEAPLYIVLVRKRVLFQRLFYEELRVRALHQKWRRLLPTYGTQSLQITYNVSFHLQFFSHLT